MVIDPTGNIAIAIIFSVAGLLFLGFMIYILVSHQSLQESWNRAWNLIGYGLKRYLDEIIAPIVRILALEIFEAKTIAKAISDSYAKVKVKPSYRTEREWHHLVAQEAPNAVWARNILNKVGIGVNDLINLAYIKTGLHRRLHLNSYYGWANSVVISAYNSAHGNLSVQSSNVKVALLAIRAYVMRLDVTSPY